MTFPTKTLAALLVTASIPLFAGQAAAAPIGQSLALGNVETSNVEQVQWRRGWRRGGWVGPAAGLAAGVAIGSALAPRTYYDEPYAAYGYAAPAPTLRYAPGYYAYGSSGFGGGACTGEEGHDSANPSWRC